MHARPQPQLERRTARFGLRALLCVGLLVPVATAQQPVTLKLEANRKEIFLGESVILHVVAGGLRNPSPPDVSAITNAEVALLSSRDVSRQSVTIINGRVMRDTFEGHEFTYRITPRAPGTVTLGPVTLQTTSRPLHADGPVVRVQGIESQDFVRIEILPSATAVLPDEEFTVTLRVLLKRLPGRYADVEPLDPNRPPLLQADYLGAGGVEGLEGPEPSMIDFLRPRLARRSEAGMQLNDYTVDTSPFGFGGFLGEKESAKFAFDRRVQIDGGVSYFEYSIALRYRARDEGDYTFGPAIFRGAVIAGVDGAGRAESRPVYAVGPAAMVRVIPPPAEGRPPSYIGLLGRNFRSEAALDTHTCNVGDPLTLTVRVTGRARFRDLWRLDLGAQPAVTESFRVYEDTMQMATTDDSVTYTMTLRPRRAGTFELPPIETAVYDLDAQAYRVLRTAPLPLRVNEASIVDLEDVIRQSTNAAARAAATRNEYAHPAALRIDPAGAYAARLDWTRAAVTAAAGPTAYGALLLLQGLAGALRRRRERRGTVSRRAILRRLERLCVSPVTPPEAHACWTALAQHLAHRLPGVQASATPPELAAALAASAPTAHAALARALGELYDHAFHPDAAPRDLAAQAAIVRTALARKRRSFALLALALLALLPRTATAAGGDGDPFGWEHANAALARATSPAEHAAAATFYERLLARGIRNGPLLLNYGTALLGAGHTEAALEAYAGAERYLGHDPDVRRNLLYALARLRPEEPPELHWGRIPLALHYALPLRTRIHAAAAAFAALWFLLAVRRLAPGRWGTLQALVLFLCVSLATSALTSLHQEREAAFMIGAHTAEAETPP